MGLYDKMKNQNQPANNSVMAKPAEGSFTFTFPQLPENTEQMMSRL